EDLVRQGGNVSSTMSVQDVASVHDLVEKFTGVRVKERVADYVLGMADQLVNVDVSAEDLRERLEAGKVYPRERVPDALANFFTQQNLTPLRELAPDEIRHPLDRRPPAAGETPRAER